MKRRHALKRTSGHKIQRFIRGHFARAKWTELVQRRDRLQEKMVFDYYAEQMQKIWRGHFSRRYKHDFWARKEYLEKIVSQGAALKEELDGYAAEQARADEERRAERREKEFKKVTRNLHHLLSTKSSPGIYNNPYMAQSPKIGGVAVEDHLRAAVKDYLRENKLDRKKAYKPPKKLTSSIMAECSYDEERERARMETKFSRLKRMSTRSFRAGAKIKDSERESVRPLNVGEPYIEPHEVQLTTKQLHERNKEARVSDKPFIFSVPTGKNFADYDYESRG
jgi:hypothetical protein